MKNQLFQLLTCLFLLIGTQGIAQQYTTGLNLELDLEKYSTLDKISSDSAVIISKSGDIPDFKNLKIEGLTVTNQGPIPMCVVEAFTNATILALASAEKWTAKEANQFLLSRKFVYNQNKSYESCEGGLSLYAGGLALQTQGTALYQDFDRGLDPHDCQTQPSDLLREEAMNNRIKGFYPLFDYEEKAKKKQYLVMEALANGNPVVVGMSVRENIIDAKEFWTPNEGRTTPLGAHAMVVVGYDNRKGAFEIMNSWGTKWGNGGYTWISYDDFGQFCDLACIVAPNKIVKGEQPVLAMQGQFDMKKPYFNKGKKAYKELKVTRKDDFIYALNTKAEIGDMYALIASKITKDNYVYVFSVDEDGENYHWPRNEKYDREKFYQATESSLIPYDSVEIVMPGKDRALIRRSDGTDNICILYSDQPIENLNERVTLLMRTGGEFKERFTKAFHDILIPTSDIDYLDRKMFYTTQTTSKGTVVPIILSIEGE